MVSLCFQVYNHFGNSTISLVPFIAGPPTIITADLDVARQVSTNKGMKTFEKPDSANAIFMCVDFFQSCVC